MDEARRRHAKYEGFGIMRVSSDMVDMLRRMGLDLRPATWEPLHCEVTAIEPMKRPRFSLIERAQELARHDIASDASSIGIIPEDDGHHD